MEKYEKKVFMDKWSLLTCGLFKIMIDCMHALVEAYGEEASLDIITEIYDLVTKEDAQKEYRDSMRRAVRVEAEVKEHAE